VADDEALGAVAQPDVDLLDAQVIAHGLVAALARERRLGVQATGLTAHDAIALMILNRTRTWLLG
jgi:hypothetical protein